MSIIKKLFEIQKMNLSVKKDGRNPHFKNEYITLDKLVSTLQPICNELGILITHNSDDKGVTTVVIDVDSHDVPEKVCAHQTASYFPLGDTTNPQKVGSAITYAKRYNLCQIFNIITDRDDDGNNASLKEKVSTKVVLTPFTDEDLKHLRKHLSSFETPQKAVDAISTKRILTGPDKEAITFLFE